MGAVALAAAGGAPMAVGGAGDGALHVRGVTISCQTSGREWGSDGFGVELGRLAELGVNWVAIHPYARIDGDGTVRWRAIDPQAPPRHLARPVREARSRGMAILIHPHLAYWGGPFRHRGEIAFEAPEALERFFASYRAFLVELCRALPDVDGLVVGSELDGLAAHEARWRELIAALRAETGAKLTFASNWSDFERVGFWDALDAVGVQAYFPLSDAPDPSEAQLRAGWDGVLARLRAVHERTGKPVVLTELGYNASLDAAREPWGYRTARGADLERARGLQEACLRTALEEIAPERSWLRGAFLWKWFVGPAPGENFVLDTPALRAAIADAWR